VRPLMKLSPRWHLRALFLLGPLALASSAGAQDIAAAEALFNKGVADMQAGRFETGCKAIAESQRIDPRLGTLFSLATCERKWGHIATAVTRYGDYLALYERLPEDKKAEPVQALRRKEAAEMRAQLQPQVPQLTVSLPKGAPAGTLVKRNGEALAEAALGLRLPVDPGEHTLSTQAPGGAVWERKITIAAGETKQVTLEVKGVLAASAATAPAQPGREEPGPPRSYVGPIIAFGAGVAGLGVGAGFGAAAMNKRAELGEICPDRNCPVSAEGTLNDTKAFSHVSTAGFLLAGVGAAVGGVLLFLPAPRADRAGKVGVRVGPGCASLEGKF
jgi:hypothetical protein